MSRSTKSAYTGLGTLVCLMAMCVRFASAIELPHKKSPNANPHMRATWAYVQCLKNHYNFSPLKKIHHSNAAAMEMIDTSALNAQPLIISGLNTGFLQHEKATQSLADFMTHLSHIGYGDMAVRWQHMSTGNASSNRLTSANKNYKDYYTSFAEAASRIELKRREILSKSKECISKSSSAMMDALTSHPLFATEALLASPCAHDLQAMVAAFCLTNSSPLYMFASSHMPTVYDDSNGEKQQRQDVRVHRPSRGRQRRDKGMSGRAKKRKRRREISNVPKRLREDGILSSTLPPVPVRIILPRAGYGSENPMHSVIHNVGGNVSTPKVSAMDANEEILLNGIDVYFGMAMSGSFMHTHGTAVASSSGRKLWILYSPEKECLLSSVLGQQMLARANLPPLCDERNPFVVNINNKHHPDSSLCLGHLHPLEMLRKMLDLEEAARPMLVMTNSGDAVVIPERWMHMTVNLEEQFTVSYRFQRSWPTHLGCSMYKSLGSSVREMEAFEIGAT